MIPEFLYEHLYNDKHFLNVINVETRHVGKLPKGVYERLLCDECEHRFSTWEKYAKDLLSGDAKGVTATNVAQNVVRVSGITYAPFKLFLLSVLWRAGVTSRDFFATVDLGPHEPILRTMLLSGDPGKATDYGCLMFGLKYESGDVMDDVIYKPIKIRQQGKIGYQFVFGGLRWDFIVSKQPLRGLLGEALLRPDGTLMFMVRVTTPHELLDPAGKR